MRQNSRGAADVARALEGLFEFTGDGLGWRRKKGVPSLYAAYEFLGPCSQGSASTGWPRGRSVLSKRCSRAGCAARCAKPGSAGSPAAGGVFMNVKANLAILELPEVESMFVFPSCGDESNSIGAACFAAAQRGRSHRAAGRDLLWRADHRRRGGRGSERMLVNAGAVRASAGSRISREK